MTKVFVYGTLKEGHYNNYLLVRGKKLGEAMTLQPFVLYNCGFPIAVEHSEDAPLLPVMGEVWEVDAETLLRLDRLEGHPDWYERKKVSVTGDYDGEVDMYIQPNSRTKQLSNIIDNMYYKWG